MIQNKKYFMHSRANIASFFIIPPIFVILGVFMSLNAYDKTALIIGISVMALLLIFSLWLFIARFRILDRLEFTGEGVVRHSVFGPKLTYSYVELVAAVGVYSSVFEQKKCLILTPKKLGVKVVTIDTSKRGNLSAANRLGVVFCIFDEALLDSLGERADLEWNR